MNFNAFKISVLRLNQTADGKETDIPNHFLQIAYSNWKNAFFFRKILTKEEYDDLIADMGLIHDATVPIGTYYASLEKL